MAVAVCKGADEVIHVVHVERLEEESRVKIDEAWMRGIGEEVQGLQPPR